METKDEINGVYEIIGNAFRLKLPDGEYYYNKLDTIKALVNGQLINPETKKRQYRVRACYGGNVDDKKEAKPTEAPATIEAPAPVPQTTDIVTSTKFRNKTTGEIVTQFDILDVGNFEKVETA